MSVPESPSRHRIVVLVNDFASVTPGQTTAQLALGALRRGAEVSVAAADGLSLDAHGRVQAAVRRLDAARETSPERLVAALQDGADSVVHPGDLDLLLLRLNPGRDPRRWAQSTALDFARIVRDAGTLVLNDPDGLVRASTKLYLQTVPARWRPRTIVTRSVADVRAFLADEAQGVVLKPLLGTRGRDVFLVRPSEATNLNQIVDVLARDGYAMVQSFVPEARDGDVRLVVVDGTLLEVDGEAAAVARVPARDDFRSNVSVGGRAAPAEVTPAMREAAAATGEILREDGIFLAGLDFIGGKLVEINVFAAGGLGDAGTFYDRDFNAAVVDRLFSEIERARTLG